MSKIYAELIRKGLKTIDQVPEAKRAEAEQELIAMGYPELADPEPTGKEEMV